MAPANDPSRVARIMLSWHSLELVSCTPLQTLWAGYGHICALTARALTDEAAEHLNQLCGVAHGGVEKHYSLILKLISPPGAGSSPPTDEGHLRKMLSYEVEQTFYDSVAPRLGDEVAVARCLASTRDMAGQPCAADLRGLMATVMVDLRGRFPVAGEKRSALNGTQVCAALDWLAAFHRRSWALLPERRDLDAYVRPPLEEGRRRRSAGGGGKGLWLNGGYTYLATRRKEYAALARDGGSEWSAALCCGVDGSSRSVAEMVALFLTPCGRPVESYIHGDVKAENLFTTESGDEVAFFDFQYVGLGLGVCDLAKLFTCAVPLDMLVDAHEPLPERLAMGEGERQLLLRYHASLLRDKPPGFYEWDEFARHWETALVDWCRFQASWGFWGNTEWLEARVRSILSDQGWRDWLQRSISSRDGQNEDNA
ncbi:hypothetical protein HFD88_010301 [Aspergillus terreus]|nr:hypothetical protein HFD88_010301 [Aspergillus terreus]